MKALNAEGVRLLVMFGCQMKQIQTLQHLKSTCSEADYARLINEVDTANKTTPSVFGDNALMCCLMAGKNHETTARFLINTGAELTQMNSTGVNVLSLACHSSFQITAHIVERLEAVCDNCNTLAAQLSSNDGQHTALGYAFLSQDMKVVDVILAAISFVARKGHQMKLHEEDLNCGCGLQFNMLLLRHRCDYLGHVW